MLAVVDQPPFFLVPSQVEDSFATSLRDWADRDRYANVAVVGFAPFFARQFEWTFGRQIPHSRPIALAVTDVWRPTKSNQVLIATSIDDLARDLLVRFGEENADIFLSPEGELLQFVRWDADLGYVTAKSELAAMRATVILPYDFAHFKLPEFVAMGMPIFMHAQLWKWTVRWSQLIARPGGRNATLYRSAPEACYDSEGADGLPMPRFPDEFFKSPWGEPLGVGDEPPMAEKDEECFAALQALEEEGVRAGPPYGRAPFGLYTVDRKHLQPLDGAAFWSRWSEMALIPHTLFFDSHAQLLDLLRSTSLGELHAISGRQLSWHRKTAFQVLDFWRGLIGSLVAGDARAFKGSAGAAAAE
mmetsp:Transcript_137633/g.439728  ORF Transcript_137633/g.439728 Transcript_137633/m.439728 type:complete len:359 (-) Transcript_137633:332-1408(-)